MTTRTRTSLSPWRRVGVATCLSMAMLAVPAAPAKAAEVVAQVGDTEVTGDELRTYLDTLTPAEQAALARDPALLSQAVRSYLARRLVVQAAKAKQWDRQPAVQAQLARVLDETLAELYLQSVSQPLASYPSEAEVEAAYLARPAAFDQPPQYRVAQIFIASGKAGDRQAEERARARLDTVVKKLQAQDADFAAIARESSDERTSADNGGEIGWLSEAQLVPAIRPAVVGMANGAVSAPIRLEEGWHLVKLLDSRPASRRPLPEVREPLAAQLRAERALANRRTYLARLLEQSPPAINELELSKLLMKSP
jgi:parvulin-like peptidyl-prolyl isomerase